MLPFISLEAVIGIEYPSRRHTPPFSLIGESGKFSRTLLEKSLPGLIQYIL
jgi:hypothetical protein